MTRQRAAAISLAIVALVAWWTAVARLRTPVSPPSRPAAVRKAPTAAPALFDYEAQRVRLDSRVTDPVVLGDRNPFAFASSDRGGAGEPARRGRVDTGAPVASTPADVPERFPFTLIGIATRGGPVARVAVFSGAGQVILAAPGETLATPYVVDAVTGDVVEIRNSTTGRVLRLALH